MKRLFKACTLFIIPLFSMMNPIYAQDTPRISIDDCPPGNIAIGADVNGELLHGNPYMVTDGILPGDGVAWNDPAAVVLKEPASYIVLDLGKIMPARAMILQADNNDQYPVSYSVDGTTWNKLLDIPENPAGEGLRTRSIKFPKTYVMRYVRISPRGGDGLYSVSEFRLYCHLPTPWPPKVGEVKTPAPVHHEDESFLNQKRVDILKAILAVLGMLLLLWWWILSRTGNPSTDLRIRKGALVLLGIAGFALWFNMFRFHFDNYIHNWEFFHYYMGAKYAPELGYDKLYSASVIAGFEDGQVRRGDQRTARNLENNQLVPVDSLLERRREIKSEFTPRRWQKFKSDLQWFRNRLDGRWAEAHKDHGYNATPVWGILGYALTNSGRASDSQMNMLALLDPILLVLMWLMAWWAFGWRATFIAFIFWGGNYVARFWWTGGSLLRHDWLVWSVTGIALLKKQKHFGGGFFLMYAALLRIFPGFILVALGLKIVALMWHRRKFVILPVHRNLILGSLTAIILFMPLSIWVHQESGIWQEFAENSRKHLKTPLTNNMGLKTVLAYKSENVARKLVEDNALDPFHRWKEVHLENIQSRYFLYILILFAYLLLVAWRSWYREDWVMAILGTGLIAVAVELTCYYYAIFAVYGFLWLKRQWVGIVLCGLAAVTYLIAALWDWYDEIFTWNSLAFLVFIFLVAYDATRISRPQTTGK